MKRLLLQSLLCISLLPITHANSSQEYKGRVKPRVVVTADPELDDQNSLIRYLLYSCDFQTEGLIYASSRWHWKGDGTTTHREIPSGPNESIHLDYDKISERWGEGERFIHEMVEAYEKVYPNLVVHDSEYPTPAYLKSKIRFGNITFVGDMDEDTPGSNLIKSLLLDDNQKPIYLLAWAGQSTIARALKSIELEYKKSPNWDSIYEKVCKKAIIQSFSDQDWTYATYIKPNWPDIEYRQMATGTWGYDAWKSIQPEDLKYLSGEWTRDNISSKGPLGKLYRVWADGQKMKGDESDFFGLSKTEIINKGIKPWVPIREANAWISEGDTSTFMNLIDNGLRGNENATWGGWGGRAGVDIAPNGEKNYNYASARFFADAQNDFAARLQWSMSSEYNQANHAPEITFDEQLQMTAPPGGTIILSAHVIEPDADSYTVTWWQYKEAGTCSAEVTIGSPKNLQTVIAIPKNAKNGDIIHLILQVTDNGKPNMTRYKRITISII
ncbi:MAG: DUF1593 domain-containing protein [Opitutales bacterium]|nr:DUF1593 domain-containing protein [Opitutales bacterium]